MNKKAQMSLGIAIVIAILIFLMGIPVINILKPEIDTARGSSGLDCTNTSITDGNRLTCLGVDIVLPYFIWIVLASAGGVVIARFVT